MTNKNLKKWGKLAFVVGVFLAILAGVFTSLLPVGIVTLVLVLLGLVVGLLNITDKETANFLVAAIALMMVGTAGVDRITLLGLGTMFKNIVMYIAVFVAPAAVIVALKSIFDLAKD